jgi:hypothetical protein
VRERVRETLLSVSRTRLFALQPLSALLLVSMGSTGPVQAVIVPYLVKWLSCTWILLANAKTRLIARKDSRDIEREN